MNIIYTPPPEALLNRIIGAGLQPTDHTVFTYGEDIYVPSGEILSDDLVVHEETHTIQQGDDPERWWDQYLSDPYFRLHQEAEAYARQYKYLCRVHKDRNKQFRILVYLAGQLSGPIYGNMLLRSDAMSMIKSNAKVT